MENLFSNEEKMAEAPQAPHAPTAGQAEPAKPVTTGPTLESLEAEIEALKKRLAHAFGTKV
jgi:hypothetical protein